jgi:hypothetical protein
LFKFIPNICTIRTWKLDCYILLIISMALVKFNLGAKLIISIKYPMYIRKIVSNYLSPNCYNKKKKQSLKKPESAYLFLIFFFLIHIVFLA